MSGSQKLGKLQDGKELPFEHPTEYRIEFLSSENSRIVAGISRASNMIFTKLAALLDEPLFLLYVLHTPRGEGEAGRYQSPEITTAKLDEFLKKFNDFLSLGSISGSIHLNLKPRWFGNATIYFTRMDHCVNLRDY